MASVPNRSLILYLLAAMNFTHIVDFMIMMPLGNYLMELFSISAQQFTVIVSSFAFSAGVSGFLSAFLIDRFDRKKALLFTYIGFTVGTLSVSFANSYEQLVLARILTGIFGGVISALVLSIVSDLYQFKERGRAMGIVSAAFAAASVLGVPLGLFLASKLFWHAPFIMLGSLGVVLSVVAILVFPSMTDHLKIESERISFVENIRHVLSSVFKDQNQLMALGVSLFIILGQFMIIPFIAPFMQRNVGFTEDTITLLYMFGGGAVVFTGPLIGKITDRIGPLRVFVTFLFLSAIPVIILTNLGPTPLYLALIVSTSMFILVNGRMIPMQTMTTAVVPPQTRASYMSIKSSIQQVSAALASLISGSIVYVGSDEVFHNFPIVGYMAIGIGLLSLLIAPRLKVAAGN